MTKPYKHFKGLPTKALSLFKLLISTADWSKFNMNKWNEKNLVVLLFFYYLAPSPDIVHIYTVRDIVYFMTSMFFLYLLQFKIHWRADQAKALWIKFERNGVLCYRLLKTFFYIDIYMNHEYTKDTYTCIYIYIC